MFVSVGNVVLVKNLWGIDKILINGSWRIRDMILDENSAPCYRCGKYHKAKHHDAIIMIDKIKAYYDD